MTANQEKAIEVAKTLETTQFGGVLSYSFKDYSGSGYLYERKAPKEIEKRIVEIEGTYIGPGDRKGTILLKGKKEEITLTMVRDTTYSRSIAANKSIMVGESIYAIAIKAEDYPIYISVAVLRESEKMIFSMVRNLFGKANAIKDFYRLDIGKQEAILKQLKGERYERFAPENDAVFATRQEQMLKYALTKETYTPDTQRVMEFMFKDAKSFKNKVEQRQAYISRIAPVYEARVPVTPEEFSKMLDENFYKMNRPKQLLRDIFAAAEKTEKKGCKILLVGAPGVGKTSLMMAIAKAMNLPYECIPLNGLSSPLEIEGIDPGYDNADAGAIIRAFAAHGTSQMVIALDEFDKMNRESKEGDPMNVFLRLFLGDHYDKFLQCTIKTDNTVFIATANSLDDIPEAVKNRFDAIIYLDEYSAEDKMEIAKRYIIPDVLKKYNLSAENIQFEDGAIAWIIANYCEDDGARDVRHNIEKVISRIISSNMSESEMVITDEYVETVLHDLVEETPGLYFSRNRSAYTEPVAKEIKKCIAASKKTVTDDSDRFGTDKMKQKLECLLACRKEVDTYLDEFDPKALSDALHQNLFGMDKVIKEVTNFYYTDYLQGTRVNSNLALYGGMGVGKSTIVKNIADALNYKYVKISFNGVEDIKELRGFNSVYNGSGPGRFMKGIKDAGTTKLIFQLDEIDKVKPEVAMALIDLLDREFTDSFLEVPVDLSQSIFIATANNWENVPAVLRDRFIVVNVDGYTRDEKSQIVSDYIIPKLEKNYAASGVSISMDGEAEDYFLRVYASSFGVRDAEKAMQCICTGKLMDQMGDEDPMKVIINKNDVNKYLGAEPVPRGNFPDNCAVPGVSKALAVSNGITGSTFAIETVLTEGDEVLETTGLAKEIAMDSVKIAVTCMKKMYPELLKGKRIHVHFGEGSVSKDGPSAGAALFMSILSAALNKPLMYKEPYDIAYTGEISLTGGVFAVGGIFEKIQAACDSGCRKVFIPMQNYERLDKQKLDKFECEVIPVTHISQIVKAIYPEL